MCGTPLARTLLPLPIYSSHATLAAGKVAALAEERKVAKYNGLPVTHSFTPVAIETLGAIGPKSLVFLKWVGGLGGSLGTSVQPHFFCRNYLWLYNGETLCRFGGGGGGLRG